MMMAEQVKEDLRWERRHNLRQGNATWNDMRADIKIHKKRVKDGEETLEDLLNRIPESFRRMKFGDFLRMGPGFGPARIERILEKTGYSWYKEMGSFTQRQCEELAYNLQFY